MKEEIVIEIPKNSNVKYEIENGKIKVDRILYGSMIYPENYGYFENTLDYDGDPLDIILISNNPLLPTSIVSARIIGAIKMIDDGETDTKIIGVIDKDPRLEHIESINNVPPHMLKIYKDFFQNYKNLQNKKVEILGFEGLSYAKKEIEETRMLYKKYKDLPKDEFLSKMKSIHPEKYN